MSYTAVAVAPIIQTPAQTRKPTMAEAAGATCPSPTTNCFYFVSAALNFSLSTLGPALLSNPSSNLSLDFSNFLHLVLTRFALALLPNVFLFAPAQRFSCFPP
jgi:hypothetical protein